MDIAEIVISAISGVLGALVGHMLLGRSRENKNLHVAAVVSCVLIFAGLGRALVLPAVHRFQVERSLQGLSFFSELRKADPATTELIVDEVTKAMDRPGGKGEIREKVSKIVADFFPRNVGRASDDSVIQFITLQSNLTHRLEKDSPEACYDMLYPQKARQPGLLGRVVRGEEQAAILDAMAKVIGSAAQQPQAPADAQQGEALLAGVMRPVVEQFGEDLKLLDLNSLNVDQKRTVCAINTTILRTALQLSPQESSLLLRHMIAPATKP